jgi:NAD(P)-dependent dehydrogenase (short-subunit alcohol dehydrogenase family)
VLGHGAIVATGRVLGPWDRPRIGAIIEPGVEDERGGIGMAAATRDFEGKVAIVTGAAGGIGAATARVLGSRGAKVLVVDLDGERAEAVATEIGDAGGEARPRVVDVSDEGAVEAMVADAVDTWGRLDVAVNNAGILGGFVPTADTPTETFDRIIAVNVRGVFLGMKHEIPAMLAGGGGAVVNTSSAAGLVAVRGVVAYAASKHAVVGMTKVAGVEYAAAGVRVNCVNPGGVVTPMIAGLGMLPEGTQEEGDDVADESHPIGRMAHPSEVANAIAFLASDAASDITGVALPVDGGMVAV